MTIVSRKRNGKMFMKCFSEQLCSLGDMQNTQDSCLHSIFAASYSHTCILIYVYLPSFDIHPKFGRFCYTVNSIFMTEFCDSVCVFRIVEIRGATDHR